MGYKACIHPVSAHSGDGFFINSLFEILQNQKESEREADETRF